MFFTNGSEIIVGKKERTGKMKIKRCSLGCTCRVREQSPRELGYTIRCSEF
jgi:hypothetical protein